MNFVRYKISDRSIDFYISLLIFCAVYIVSSPIIGQSPSVSVLYDTDYVETCQISTCEGFTLNSFLNSIGNDVQTFEGIDSSSIFDGLSCHETFFLPETETGNFAADISDESTTVIKEYVSNGGLMIIMGSDGLNQMSSNSAQNLNSIFSFDIQNVNFTSSGYSFLNPDVSYPFLSAFPDSLRNFTTTNFIGNLPAGAEILYSLDSDNPSVVNIPYGDGHIIYLGWSFFNGGPIGSQGPDNWSLLIQVLIENFATTNQYPDCDACDTNTPSRVEPNPNLSSYLDLNGIVSLRSEDYEYLYEDNCNVKTVKIISESTLGCSNSYEQELIIEVLDNVGNQLLDTLEIRLIDTVIPEFINFPKDVTIECHFDETPVLSETSDYFSTKNEDLIINRLELQSFELETGIFPSGSLIEEVDFYFHGSFNDLDDLWISVEDDRGNSALLLSQVCDGQQDIDVWFSDNGSPLNCQEIDLGTERFLSANNGLDIFKHTEPSEKYTFTIINQGNLAGIVKNIGVKINYKSDLSLPSVNEACSFQLTYDDTDSRTSCPIGTVIRRFTVIDESGNTNIRDQIIEIVDSRSVDIQYPKDYFYQCNGLVSYLDSLEPDDLPQGYDLPVVSDDCRDYVSSFSDKVISSCGNNNIEIERTWVVQSMCEPDISYFHKQRIGVIDTIAPLIGALPGYIEFVDDQDCLSGSNFDFPDQADLVIVDCDPVLDIQMRVIDSSGVEFFSNELQAGNYLVEIKVTDQCGNVGFEFVPVEMRDITPPQIICKNQVTQIQLNQLGNAMVCGAQLIESFEENCGIDRYQVNFMPTFNPDSECLLVDCYNLGVKTVYIRAIDFGGNQDVCSTQIRVVDRDEPQLICNDITISCDEAFDPMNYPLPLAIDNCNPNPNVICGNFLFIGNSCDSIYVRECIARDGNGNETSKCTQTLTKVDTSSLIIDWPQRLVKLSCGSDPSPDFAGRPTILSSCGQFDISYSESQSNLCGSPELFSILRRWQVRNICTQSLETFNQEVQISDITPPVFMYPATSIVRFSISDFNCERSVTIVPEAIDDCSNNIIYSNSISGNFRELTRIFDIGLHPVTFYATDMCGNTDSIVVDISVEENKNPFVSCKSDDDFLLNEVSFVDIYPREILDTAFDLCSENSDLDYFISKVLPSGQDIGRQPFVRYECHELGFNEARLYVRDASNNLSYCDLIINIVDTFRNCPFGDFYDISGMIFDENRLILGGAKARLNGLGLNGFDDGREGNYHIRALPKDSSYSISVVKDYSYKNGVTALDLSIIQRHLLQLSLLASPYKILAADVNNDEKVSVLDLAIIRSLLLGITDEFASVPSWRFLPELYEFFNPSNPFERTIPYADTVFLEGRSIKDVNFVGVKMGDVDNSANSFSFDGSNSNRTQNTLEVNYSYMNNQKVLVTLNKPNSWLSAQVYFDIDNRELELILTDLDENEYVLDNDQLNFIWSKPQFKDDITFFRFLITLEEGEKIENVLRLNENRNSLTSTDLINESSVKLKFTNSGILSEGTYCFDVFPTLWERNIQITTFCSDDSKLSYRIIDINGVTLYEDKHVNIKVIKAKDMKGLTPGVYFLEIVDQRGNSKVFKTIKR